MVDQTYFETCTGLQLVHTYNNRYIECSGQSYSYIQVCIREFNAVNNTYVYCYNDFDKDATYIYL